MLYPQSYFGHRHGGTSSCQLPRFSWQPTPGRKSPTADRLARARAHGAGQRAAERA
jgi:hypothetical protein